MFVHFNLVGTELLVNNIIQPPTGVVMESQPPLCLQYLKQKDKNIFGPLLSHLDSLV